MTHEYLIAGLLGGVTSTLVLHPLDLLKVRFAVSDGQSKLKKDYRSIRNAVSTIAREEGYKGFYKGVLPNCLGAGTAWGLYFLFYNTVKKQMLETTQKPSLGVFEHMGAGAIAGALTTAITNPIWVIKTRLCLQYGNVSTAPTTASSSTATTSIPKIKENNPLPESKRYSGTWDALKKVYKYEGLSGLYRGFIPGLLGVSHGALQLAAYEEMKKFYFQRYDLPSDQNLDTFHYLTCAAASKLLAASVTYPCQVLRARLQDQHVNYTGVIDVFKRTLRYESYLGFYKGFSAYMLHVTPNICIVFLIYETVTKALRRDVAANS